jgi:asparagine synthase (glutamine-hydrolysing)
MCGICGYYSNKGIFSGEDLEKMKQALLHRGPDAEGSFIDGPIGLGHRRLSIIDLSSSANQPMTSHNGRYVMVFNGEIYNYQEIEKDLRLTNYDLRLKTTSDSEVILEAFSHWGYEFVNRLNGMFVIVFYDKEEKSLYIFRDRIGIKPLYYYWDGNNFAFASELKALKRNEFISRNLSLNYTAINEYLHLGYIPEPHSVYDKIFKFPSGSWGKLSSRISNSCSLEIQKYWNIDEKISDKLITNEQEAKEKLKELLISSVKYRMISDVPFGTFLSGGIDSSLVTAIAQSLSSEPVKTFNIRFEDAKFDESPYAKTIAAYLGTNHHESTVTEKDALELIPQLHEIYDEPFADSSAIPTLLVSKMARQNVTMTLSGDGGDELFMGYGAYRWAERLNNPLNKVLRAPIKVALSSGSSRKKRVSHLFEKVPADQVCSHIFSQEQYLFSRSEIKKLLNPDFFREFKLGESPVLSRKLTAAEKQSLFDLKYYLKDDLLVKVDRASMHHSLETRVPLLDYRIVEFAYNLHPSLRLNGKTTKYLLKQVLYDYIPSTYYDRPKQGFAVPLNKWMKKDLKNMTEENLLKNNEILNQTYIHSIHNQYKKGDRDYLYNRIWEILHLLNCND